MRSDVTEVQVNAAKLTRWINGPGGGQKSEDLCMWGKSYVFDVSIVNLYAIQYTVKYCTVFEILVVLTDTCFKLSTVVNTQRGSVAALICIE